MKHLLNDISSEEKNSIREQYEGGMIVDTSKFKKLLETKLGDAKPLVNESASFQPENSLVFGKELKGKGYLEGRWKKIKTDGTLNIYYIDNNTKQPVFYRSIDTGWGEEINKMIPKINQVGNWSIDGGGNLSFDY